MKTLRLILAMLMLCIYTQATNAFNLGWFQVDFADNVCKVNTESFDLIEVRVKHRTKHREITYYCIDNSMNAVAFRLYQADNGRFIRLTKLTCNK